MGLESGPEIDLLIGPDGEIRFTVHGVSGAECDALEAMMLEILRGEIVSREHTPEYYAEQSSGVVKRLLQRLGKK